MTERSPAPLRSLLAYANGPCVSIFLALPAPGTAEVQEVPSSLARLVDDAEAELLGQGLTRSAIRDLLAPARSFITQDVPFWSPGSAGMALFVAPGLMRVYKVPVELPARQVVGPRFDLTPLAGCFHDDAPFYILALSKKQARLFRATQHHTSEIGLPGAPRSLEESLGGAEHAKEHQLHVGISPAARGHAGSRGAIFHGQGDHADVEKDQLLRYCQQVERAVHRVLRNEHAPLVLAGVEYLLAIYRGANSYPHLVEEGVVGNPDDLTAPALWERAWPLVAPRFAQAEQAAAERYALLAAAQPTHIASALDTVLPAAFAGLIETLFVAVGQQRWGTFDSQTGAVAVHKQRAAGDEELVGLAMLYASLNGATLYAMPEQMAEPAPVAAILRYAAPMAIWWNQDTRPLGRLQ
jgi:hypothetical protein